MACGGDVDRARPRPTLAVEADLDADLAQERRGPAQPTRQSQHTRFLHTSIRG
jgi:hypothetical protein